MKVSRFDTNITADQSGIGTGITGAENARNNIAGLAETKGVTLTETVTLTF